MQPLPKTTTGSQLIAALEAVWAEIRARHPEVPEVVMVTGSGKSGLGLVWGHHRSREHAWRNGRFIAHADGTVERDGRPEIFVSGECLGAGPAMVLETMLHEAAHALADARGVKDTSRQNRYHNGRFRAFAEELGLEYKHDTPDTVLGYSDMTLTEETREAYREVLEALERTIALTMELPSWVRAGLGGALGGGRKGGDGIRGGGRRGGGQGRGRNYVKAACGCPRTIRVAPSVLEAAPITCGACGQDFTAAE